MSVTLTQLQALIHRAIDLLSFWHGYENVLRTLAIVTVGLAGYTAVIFAFYQNMSRRDIFATPSRRSHGWWGRLLSALQYVFLFPLASFLFFAVLSASLFFLAKSQSTVQLLVISMAVVVGVRLTAYISENMSVDLAKLLPLGLLGVLLVDPGYLSWSAPITRLREASRMLDVIGRFFLVLLLLELALRLARAGTLWVLARRRRANAAHERAAVKLTPTSRSAPPPTTGAKL